jgi:hypothetical protein
MRETGGNREEQMKITHRGDHWSSSVEKLAWALMDFQRTWKHIDRAKMQQQDYQDNIETMDIVTLHSAVSKLALFVGFLLATGCGCP